MKIICAGLSKTGTKSLTQALRTLGYTVYDATESYSYLIQQWHDIVVNKKSPNFWSMYSDVDAVVDTPGNHFYREIFEAFPDAKVILTVRDSEDVWLKSFVNHMKRYYRYCVTRPLWQAVRVSPTHQMVYNVMIKVWELKYGSGATLLENEATLKKVYREHNREVRETIPANQLLVYNVREGWGPLCDFLGCDKPNKAFPHLNIGGEIIDTHLPFYVVNEVGRTIVKETVLIFSVLVVLVAIVAYYFLNAI